MLGIRGEIAYGGKTSASHYGVGDDINVFVDLSLLKAAVQMNIPVTGNEFAIDGLRELPLNPGNVRALPVARIPDRKRIARIAG